LRIRVVSTAAVALILSLLAPLPGQAAGPTTAKMTVVVDGLNNPRQLSLGPDGALYVAEAGRGAEDPDHAPCAELGMGTTCYGMTSSVSRVDRPWRTHDAAPRRIVTGLLSGSEPDGSGAGGVSGISVDARNRIYAVATYVRPDLLPGPAAAAQNGQLLRLRVGAPAKGVLDLAAVELNQNPDGEDVNPNPYSILALPDRQIVADAGANALYEVRGGRARVLTVFPSHDGGQSVPTAVTLGPGGDYYVSELLGFSATPGSSRVYRVARDGHIVSWQGGFSNATGLAFGRDGSLYVAELFAGALVKVRPDGSRTELAVPAPTGVATDHRGNVYVSVGSMSSGNGGTGPDGQPAVAGAVWRLCF